MAKAVVDKIEDVAETMRGEYEPGAGGRFFLKIEGLTPEVPHPAVKELRDAHARSKAERQAAVDKAEQVSAALEALRTEHTAALESVVPKAQMDALRKSYEDTERAKLAAKDTLIAERDAAIRDIAITKEARAIAASLAARDEYAENFQEYITGRLQVDRDAAGKIVTRVLKDGQPSALTLDQLKEEISQMERFKPLLKGSQATGGGAVGASGGGGATGAQKPNFLTASPSEIDAWLERNKHSPGS
jgi:hypothetical protein